MDWLAKIRALPASQRGVEHEPPDTRRYATARQKLGYVLREATYLGALVVEPGRVEVAVWCPPGHGRGAGYYACFRVYVDGVEPPKAVMFCFYDGTDGSPSLRSMAAARAFAHARDFKEDV
ncbi:MAG: hypothetical protein Q8P41_05895 [Pseudomonadota bacterium]|nr:hypothetical protein [Pseudomonadota bacterium]